VSEGELYGSPSRGGRASREGSGAGRSQALDVVDLELADPRDIAASQPMRRRRELGKLQLVTLNLANPDPKLFPKSGMLGFFIDGNITRLTQEMMASPKP